MYDFMDDAARHEAERNFARRREGITEQHDFRFRRRDGSDLWTICSTNPVFDENGRFAGALAMVADITDRKVADEAVEEGEERFRNLIEGSIQGFLIHRNGKPLFANKAYADILGYDAPEEILALDSIDRHIAPRDLKRLRGYRTARMQGRPAPARYEYEAVRKDGSPIWLENCVRVVTWKGKPAIQQTTIDITERKKAVDALRGSENRYRRLVEYSPDAILIHCDGEIVFANSAAARLLGANGPSDLIGMPAIQVVPEEDRALIHQRMHKVIEQGVATPYIDERVLRFDGTRVDVEALGMPFPYKGRTAVQVIFRDISERKRHQQEISLLFTLTSTIAQAHDFQSALMTALRTLGASFGWAYGESWIPSADGNSLEPGPVWQCESPALKEYAEASQEITFAAGEGLPGRVWSSGRPEWVADLAVHPKTAYPRVALVQKAGLKAAFAVPIVTEGQALAVLSFKAFDRREQDERVVGIVSAVAAHLGSLLQRKQAEQKLRESEERFRDFAESSSDWFWEQDENLRFTFLSSEIYEKTGLPPAYFLGKTRREVVQMGLTEEQWQQHQADLDARRPFRDFQFQRFGPDETVHYISISGTPVFDEDGAFKGYRGTGRDITPEVETRQRAERAEARLREAIENMPASFILFDPLNRLVLCNSITKNFLPEITDLLVPGTDVKNLFRARLERQMPEKSPAEIEEMVQTRLETFGNSGPPHQERHPDGRWSQVFERLTAEGGTVCIRTDITELKSREEALRRSEERFRHFAESASDWLWEQDENLRFTYLSPEVAEKSGLPAEAHIGKTRREVVGDGASEEQWRQHQADLEARRPFRDFQFKRVNPTGKVHVISVSGTPAFDDTGAFKGYRGTARDITEQVEAWQRVEQAEARLIDAIESVSEGVSLYDADDRLVLCNRRYREIHMMSADALIPGAKYGDLLLIAIHRSEYPDAFEKGEDWFVARMLANRKAARPVEQKMSNGRWIVIDERPMRDGGTVCLHRDITEMKRREVAVRESEERLHGIMNNVADGIIAVQADGNIEAFNPAAERIFGYSAEEVVGKNVSLLLPEPFDAEEARLHRYPPMSQKPHTAPRTREIVAVRKDGSSFPLELSIGKTRIGRKPILIGVMRDITERRTAEAEHQRLQQELWQAQKMEALGALAGGIAHDLNNVLVPMIGLTKLTMKMTESDTPLHKNLEHVYDAANRARDLVTRILAFGRQSEPELRPIDIVQVVDDALKLLRSTIPATIEIHRRFDRDVGIILADPTQIHQILMNLGANAAYAMGHKPGVIEVKLSRIEIRKLDAFKHRRLSPGPYVRLSIRDTGCGMDPETVQRIFHPFFTTKPVGEGSGMGLSVVHGIVSRHGGTITVSSALGKGTTFDLYFPATEDAVMADERSDPGIESHPPPAAQLHSLSSPSARTQEQNR